MVGLNPTGSKVQQTTFASNVFSQASPGGFPNPYVQLLYYDLCDADHVPLTVCDVPLPGVPSFP